MLFNSFTYMLFLPAVVILFWLSPKPARNLLLLIASYGFYMSWKPIYGLLILVLTVMNYVFGLLISGCRGDAMHRPAPEAGDAWHRPYWQRDKILLFACVGANLLALGFFKYAYFTWDIAGQAASWFGHDLGKLPLSIILPLGISFFVFEFIHYISDVYKGDKPVRSFIDFALFASFFPTQIAGPIKRYQDFVGQLGKTLQFNLTMLDEGIELILFGLFKKVVFADNLAVVVQTAFEHPYYTTGLDMWLAVYAFAFQIYFDFSGYTDIACGSARLLGYKVPPNFNLPYLAGSASEFWRRWHISLSTWLRDYLFIPLGGSRTSTWFTYRNLVITMVLGGLWHGASMHFVVWGAYQGLALVVHKEYRRWSEHLSKQPGFVWLGDWQQSKAYHLLAVVVTFHLVCIGWVFFRAENMSIANQVLQKLFFINSGWPQTLTIVNTGDPVVFLLLPFLLALLFGGQILAGWLSSRNLQPENRLAALPVLVRAGYLAALLVALVVLSPDASPKFIYFQF